MFCHLAEFLDETEVTLTYSFFSLGSHALYWKVKRNKEMTLCCKIVVVKVEEKYSTHNTPQVRFSL